MGNSNGKITAPISLHADVYPVLGLAKSGTYYDVGYVSKNAHGKINQASRHKPMDVNTHQTLTTAQKQAALYGHSITNTTQFINNNQPPSALTSAWTYVPPIIYSRLTDFENYDHNVRVVKGDWGVVGVLDPFDTSSPIVGTFVDKMLTSNLYEHYEANSGRAVDIYMRDNNPSKTTQVNPYICNMRIAFVVYKAIPASSPIWSKVKAVVLPVGSVGLSSTYASSVSCSELGYSKSTIQDAELLIRIVAYAYLGTIGDGNDSYAKYSLSFTENLNVHDVYITSGAYFTASKEVMWVDRASSGSGFRLYANLYVTANAPFDNNNNLATAINNLVFAYVRFYYQDTLVATYCSPNSSGSVSQYKGSGALTYPTSSEGNQNPAKYSTCTVHWQITSIPVTWDYALCTFTAPTIDASQVKCATIKVNSSFNIVD